MKYTIKNPLNSPYNVAGEDGQVHIPARGEVTASFTDMQIHAIRATGYFTVTETGKRDPLDHDDDGRKGGAAEPVSNPYTSPEPVKETAESEHIVKTETASDVPPAPRRGRPRKNKD